MGQVGSLDPPFNQGLVSGKDFGLQQGGQKGFVGPTFGGGLLQGWLQPIGQVGQAQPFEIIGQLAHMISPPVSKNWS